MTQYKHFVKLAADVSYTEVFPLNFFSAKFKYEKQENQVFYFKSLDNKLIFTNDDFTYFNTQELLDECTIYDYLLQQKCEGIYKDYYEAKFGLSQGEWDKDRCTFSIEPTSSYLYDCILNENKVNLLDTSLPKTTKILLNPDVQYTNTRLFGDMLEYVVEQTCTQALGVISDFFQINPQNSSSINYVTGEVNPYTVMTFGAVKDVKYPIPVIKQTRIQSSFLEIMKDLSVFFNVFFTIEDGYIRIEHISYFDSTQGLDLTQAKYDKYDTDRNKYTYLPLPKYEAFTEMFGLGGLDLKITYNNGCVNISEEQVTYTAEFITTQSEILRSDPDDFNGPEDGIVLFATALSFSGLTYDVKGVHNEELNPLSLFLKFHRHNRYGDSGDITTGIANANGIDEFFTYSTKKNKLQEPIRFPLCCNEEFSPEKYQVTELGNGEVHEAEFSIKDDVLKMQLKYGDDPNTDILPSDITGLQLWLNGDVGVTTSGGSVTQWADQSGNANHATQSNVSKQPIWVMPATHGHGSILFDGIDDGLYTPSFQTFPVKRGSVFVVMRNSQPINQLNDHIVGTYGSGSGNMWDINTGWDVATGSPTTTLNIKFIFSIAQSLNIYSKKIGSPNSDAILGFPNSDYGLTNYILLELIRDADSSMKFTINGVIPLTTVVIPNTQITVNPVNIGNSFIAGNSDPLEGYISEVLIYDKAVSDYERQQLENYLFKKYKLFQYTP